MNRSLKWLWPVGVAVILAAMPAAATPNPPHAGQTRDPYDLGVSFNGNPYDVVQPAMVYSGQKIELVPSLAMGDIAGSPGIKPNDLTIISQSWTQPAGQVVGGYDTTLATNQVIAFPPLQASNNANFYNLIFYWVNAPVGLQTITYTISYSYTGGSDTKSTTVAFYVMGPANVATPANTLTPVQTWSAGSYYNGTTGPVMAPGNGNTVNGATISAACNPPTNCSPGTQTWLHLIDSYYYSYCANGCNAGRQHVSALTAEPALDHAVQYPFVNSDNALTDSPGKVLVAANTQQTVQFTATSFPMWTPTMDPNCQVTTRPCTILIPLSSVTWGFDACVINTLNPGAVPPIGWSLGSCSAPFTSSSQPGETVASYPQWESIFQNTP